MLLALILACASATTTTPPPTPAPEPPPTPASLTAVEYHFQDSSVPPPSHRSVTVSVSLDSVDYVVDSYGDIVAQAHAPGSQATLDQAVAAYRAAGFALTPPSTEPGCSGGTSRSVKVKQGSLIAFTGTLSSCGSTESGLTGDMDGFARTMKALAPPTGDLEPSTTP
ncbi:MAG: hypothetical protein ACI9VR_000164 [Cognaticolwellia sp.]|jgi:hypothetical protein